MLRLLVSRLRVPFVALALAMLGAGVSVETSAAETPTVSHPLVRHPHEA